MSANWDHDRWSEELSAYLLGALEPAGVEVFERHLEGCELCRTELRWLAPAVDMLPETVERLEPPPQLRRRLLAEVAEDARPAEGAAPARRRGGVLAWLRDVAGPHWRPLAAGAAVLLIAAAVVGYEVGQNGGSGGGNATTVQSKEASGIVAAVSMEGTEHGRIRLSNVPSLPPDKVLEAWVERDGEVEAVPTLFVPDHEGRAATTIGDMRGVSAVMVTTEPPGGSAAPTSKPIVEVPIPPA
ncbi:MAG TPA: anti-sigma factor [Solirubrobacterales bacterium]|jgi:anti-sigma factor RsiW